MYENLPIQALGVNGEVTGAYRGDKFQSVPNGTVDGDEILGRVFLDTDAGPVAIWGDASVFHKIRALDLSDGDQITITRFSDDIYRVLRHG